MSQIRAFLALKMPGEWEEGIRSLQARLRRELRASDIKWADPAQGHITLRFFGSLTPGEAGRAAEAASRAAAAASPFGLRAANLGCFPSERTARVIWLGLADDQGATGRLQQELLEQTDGIGQPPDRREFRPHLTLGRVKRMSRGDLAGLGRCLRLPAPISSVWAVSELLLMRSHPGPGGPEYEVIHSAKLGRHPSGTQEP